MRKSITLATALAGLVWAQTAAAQEFERILPNGFALLESVDTISIRDAASTWSFCAGTPDQWLSRLENAQFAGGQSEMYVRTASGSISSVIVIEIHRFASEAGARTAIELDHEHCLGQTVTAAELGFSVISELYEEVDASDRLEGDSYFFASGVIDIAAGPAAVEAAGLAWRDGRNYISLGIMNFVEFEGSIFFNDLENLAVSIQQNTPR